MSVLATDDFNRANSTSLGANWTVNRGIPGIFSNTFSNRSTTFDECAAFWSAISWPDDQYAQVTLVTLDWSAAAGVRVNSNPREGYWGGFTVGRFDGNRSLWKTVGGVSTRLIDAGTAAVAGDVYKVTVVGTTLEFFVNGVSQGTVTDSALATGSAGAQCGASVADATLLDNWSGGDFASAGTQLMGQSWM